MTLAIAIVVGLGTLALAAGIVWSVRDVARYRIDMGLARESAKDAADMARETAKHATAAEERMARLEQRALKLEQQAGWSKK